MKRNAILIALAVLLAGAAFIVADTTFEWSGPQNTGILTYSNLTLASPTISGTTTQATANITGDAAVGGNMTVTSNLTVSGAITSTTTNYTGHLDVTSNLTVGGSCTITGVTTNTGAVVQSSTLSVAGAATFAAGAIWSPGSIANTNGVYTQTVAKVIYSLAPTDVNTQRLAAATSGQVVTFVNTGAFNVMLDVDWGDVTLGSNDVATAGYVGTEWFILSTKDN